MAREVTLPLPREGARYRLEQGKQDATLAIIDGATGEHAGYIELEPSEKTLHVNAICVDADRRGYGAGSESARLLIDAATDAGYARVTAWAPPDNGLAVYFWYRMGLHACHGEGPNGGLLFEREIHRQA